ncbi:MAG: arsenite methyltransferase [Candidatus Bipolaricaulia bacterium]
MVSEKEIKQAVKEAYTKVAQRADCCGTAGCGSSGTYLTQIGYSAEELTTLPEGAMDTAAGCGNPTALAELCAGEVVLDLGSGVGIDVFLAAEKVGPAGKVIGVDMTEAMVEKARANAVEMGVEHVEFRLGEIEALPVEDESVDVIISNCVINLSLDKDAVFRETFRVLRSGGRMMISDIVTQGEIPEEIRNSLASWAGCVAGALDQSVYLNKIRDAGFKEIQVVKEAGPLGQFPVYSIGVRAIKSAAT